MSCIELGSLFDTTEAFSIRLQVRSQINIDAARNLQRWNLRQLLARQLAVHHLSRSLPSDIILTQKHGQLDFLRHRLLFFDILERFRLIHLAV